MKRCYYETLRCEKSASTEELKSSYRKLAKELHPDRNPGDHTAEVKFKEINEAYDVLKDDQKRAAYDRFGHAAFENGGPAAAGGAGLGDIFDQMFGEFMGGRGRSRGPRSGGDIRAAVEIDLVEAFAGTKVQLRVP